MSSGNIGADPGQDKRYEVTTKTTFDEFLTVMVTDRRTADIDHDALKLIFDRLFEKVLKRNEEEKHAADRHQRRAIDALRSRIKHLEPPVRSSDTWDQVRPRVEKSEEYRALDADELRKTAFDKVIRRLQEKDEDAERDREYRRRERDRDPYRRDEDREYRNGRSHRERDSRRGRLSRSPAEVDAYEADRRKAMADREKSYRKTSSLGVSPPPRRDRDRRDDRHGRLDRDRTPDRLSHYDRERREREEERERLYRTRGDPRGSRDELDYGADNKSAAGSDRRRRRGSEVDSVESGRRDSKRYKRERDRDRDRDRDRSTPPRKIKKERSATPAKVKKEPDPEPVGVHSGSEEGEIEED